jgi:hypothetical protein
LVCAIPSFRIGLVRAVPKFKMGVRSIGFVQYQGSR